MILSKQWMAQLENLPATQVDKTLKLVHITSVEASETIFSTSRIQILSLNEILNCEWEKKLDVFVVVVDFLSLLKLLLPLVTHSSNMNKNSQLVRPLRSVPQFGFTCQELQFLLD